MDFLKKKTLWFTVYGILITILFLYLLFPVELVKNKLEDSTNSPDFIVKSGSLQPSLPLGIKIKNVTISSTYPPNVFFRGELLDLQFNLLSIFRKHTYVDLSGKAYGGNFDGRIGLISLAKVYPPAEGKLNFQNIDLGKYTLIGSELGRGITGKVRGNLIYITDEISKGINCNLALFLTNGTYPLAEPFLGVTRIDFDHGEIRAQLKNGNIKLEKLEILGPRINCFLSGEITPSADSKNSRLNLNGVIEILDKNKVKMKVTISGTLANPMIRYI